MPRPRRTSGEPDSPWLVTALQRYFNSLNNSKLGVNERLFRYLPEISTFRDENQLSVEFPVPLVSINPSVGGGIFPRKSGRVKSKIERPHRRLPSSPKSTHPPEKLPIGHPGLRGHNVEPQVDQFLIGW